MVDFGMTNSTGFERETAKSKKLRRFGAKLRSFVAPRGGRFRRIQNFGGDEGDKAFGCALRDSAQSETAIAGRLRAEGSLLVFAAAVNADKVHIPLAAITSLQRDAEGIRICLSDGRSYFFDSFKSRDRSLQTMSRMWRSRRQRRSPSPTESCSNSSAMTPTTTVSDAMPSTAPSEDGDLNNADDVRNDEPASCDCGEHRGQTLLDSVYPLSVDQLFGFLFTENPQIATFFSGPARRSEMSFEDWSETDSHRKRRRKANYRVELCNTFGPKQSEVTETQMLTEMGPDAIDGYVVKKDAANAGVPYADAFTVLCTYCITRVSQNESRLRVHGEVLYKKPVLLVKAIIYKMAMDGMHEYYKNLDTFIRTNKEAISIERSTERRLASGEDPVDSLPDHFEFDALIDSAAVRKRNFELSSSPIPPITVSTPSPSLTEIQRILWIIAVALILIVVLLFWQNFVRQSPLTIVVDGNLNRDLREMVSDIQRRLSNQ